MVFLPESTTPAGTAAEDLLRNLCHALVSLPPLSLSPSPVLQSPLQAHTSFPPPLRLTSLMSLLFPTRLTLFLSSHFTFLLYLTPLRFLYLKLSHCSLRSPFIPLLCPTISSCSPHTHSTSRRGLPGPGIARERLQGITRDRLQGITQDRRQGIRRTRPRGSTWDRLRR